MKHAYLIDELAEENDYWAATASVNHLKTVHHGVMRAGRRSLGGITALVDLTPHSWGHGSKSLLRYFPSSTKKQLATGAHHPKMLEHRSRAGAHRKVVDLAKLQKLPGAGA